MKKTTLEEETKNNILDIQIVEDIVQKIEHVKFVKCESLPCSFDSRILLKTETSLLKCKSKFAKVLCINYKRSPINLQKKKHIIPKRIKLFEFKTASPDDSIKQHLKR